MSEAKGCARSVRMATAIVSRAGRSLYDRDRKEADKTGEGLGVALCVETLIPIHMRLNNTGFQIDRDGSFSRLLCDPRSFRLAYSMLSTRESA